MMSEAQTFKYNKRAVVEDMVSIKAVCGGDRCTTPTSHHGNTVTCSSSNDSYALCYIELLGRLWRKEIQSHISHIL